MESEPKHPIVLRRSNESRSFRKLGLILHLVSILIAIFSFFYPFDGELQSYAFAISAILVPVSIVSVRELTRQIVLHDNYISFKTWYRTPRVFAYDQITGVETVVVKESSWRWWSDNYVIVKFDDGGSLKVLNGLITARKFRKLLAERSKRRLRKSMKNRPVV